MMSERYIKVFDGGENLYVENAPIIIRANVLLKDSETGRMIAQLKFQNLSGKMISYVKIAVTQLDSIRNSLDKVIPFEFLDLAVADKEFFGSKKPLPLPNSSTRAFCVGVCSVGFSDGSVWSCDDTDWKPAEKGSDVPNAILAEDVYKETLALVKSDDVQVLKSAIAKLQSIQETKDVSMDIQLCEKKIEELQHHQKKKAKKRKKIVKIVSIVVAACVLLGVVGVFVLFPWVSSLNGNYSVYINMYKIKEYEIREGVTEISPDAFSNCYSLEKVTIPDGVVSIGEYAFLRCWYLKEVTLPESITSIGNGAFHTCQNLTEVTIPNGVTTIGGYAFTECSSLKKVTIPDNVTRIEEDAFSRCYSLTEMIIPDSVTHIARSAFQVCSNLETLVIPASVISIGEFAFNACDKLECVFYGGTQKDWNNIDIERYNDIKYITRYYYSETQPTTYGNYWHYVDGEITVWN